jgi:hypothetical protein
MDQVLGEVGVDPPIAAFVGIRKGAARDVPSKAGMVELLVKRAQTALNVSQALTCRQLGKGHAEKLIIAGEGAHAVITLVPIYASTERMPWKKPHQLRENRLALVHFRHSFCMDF